jgi:hypothetical protein
MSVDGDGMPSVTFCFTAEVTIGLVFHHEVDPKGPRFFITILANVVTFYWTSLSQMMSRPNQTYFGV